MLSIQGLYIIHAPILLLFLITKQLWKIKFSVVRTKHVKAVYNKTNRSGLQTFGWPLDGRWELEFLYLFATIYCSSSRFLLPRSSSPVYAIFFVNIVGELPLNFVINILKCFLKFSYGGLISNCIIILHLQWLLKYN